MGETPARIWDYKRQNSIWAQLVHVSVNGFVCAVLQVGFVAVFSCFGASFQVLLQALHSEPFSYLDFKLELSESQV